MLPQNERFGKRRILSGILLIGVLLVALLWQNGRFLHAGGEEQRFLPYIAKEGDTATTATPTATVDGTPITPTNTPTSPYLVVLPNCSAGSSAQFNILGYNWPTNQNINLSWNDVPQSIIPAGHPGNFVQGWSKSNLIVGTPENPTLYTIRAQTDTAVATAVFSVPCPGVITATPTITPTPQYCGAFFEALPLAGSTYVLVSGEVGTTVTIIDQSTGVTLGTDTFLEVPGHQCEGFADFSGSNALIAPLNVNHTLLAQPEVGQPDTAVVLDVTVTPSPVPTPSLSLAPNCTDQSTAIFDIQGANWPTNEAITLYWNNSPQSIVPAGHPGNFLQTWSKSNLILGTPEDPNIYEVRAQSNSYVVTADFYAPCPIQQPPDLEILSTPVLFSTPPIVAYQPIDVGIILRNQGGDMPAGQTFFVDIFFDPTVVLSTSIPLTQSVGYTAVSGMSSGETRIITITAPLGFTNYPITHTMYGMADSRQQIVEIDETNNVSPPGYLPLVTPAASPTPTPIPTPEYCGAFFEALPLAGSTYVWVSGEAGTTVTITDLSTGVTLGTDTFLEASGHQCDGFADFSGSNALIAPLIVNHTLLAQPEVGNPDTAVVLDVTVTPSPVPPIGTESISGIVYYRPSDWLPTARAQVTLIDEGTGQTLATKLTDSNGLYSFTDLAPGTYSVRACMVVDNTSLSGLRIGINPPNSFADVYLLPGPCSQ
ncbi:MAG: carboxypeptidase regulatory-like domain-containing protein [Chloroflexota bacterium]